MLCDIVSRNDRELAAIDGITKWIAVNSEGIYAARLYGFVAGSPGKEASIPALARRERIAFRKYAMQSCRGIPVR